MTLDADGNLETPREDDPGDPRGPDRDFREVPTFTINVNTPGPSTSEAIADREREIRDAIIAHTSDADRYVYTGLRRRSLLDSIRQRANTWPVIPVDFGAGDISGVSVYDTGRIVEDRFDSARIAGMSMLSGVPYDEMERALQRMGGVLGTVGTSAANPRSEGPVTADELTRAMRDVEAALETQKPKVRRVFEQARTVDGIRYQITEYDDGSRERKIVGPAPTPIPRAKWRAR